MSKRRWAPLARIIGVAAWIATASAAAAEGVHAFRITGPDGSSSTLLGTIHLGDPRIVQPDTAVLDGARRLIVEARPDQAPPPTPQDLLDPAAITAIKNGELRRAEWVSMLTPEDLVLLRSYVACAIPKQVDQVFEYFLALKAWRAAYAVAIPCPQPSDLSRDKMLMQRAEQTGLPIVPLETMDENQRQKDALIASLGERVFVNSLKHSIRLVGAQAITDYIKAINAGDFEEVLTISRRYAIDASEAEGVYHYMVRNRNIIWLPRLETYLQDGNAVVLVGAGHLAGPGGLIALLQRAGYSVQPILLPGAAKHP